MNKTKICSVIAYLAAFGLPCLVALMAMARAGIHPFGPDTLSVWDLKITYTYFYEWWKDCLAGDGNIFYSFSKSLGGNMLPGWYTLLASPLNLLIVFFGDNPQDYVTFMIVVKFGFAGVTSYFFARRRFGISRVMALALSVCYAMMMFATFQSANPMWLDVVVLLPLAMYGIYSIIHNGRFLLYFFSLLACIVVNYYNGYMICLFSVLYYLFESYLAAPEAKRVRWKILVNPGRFAITFWAAVFVSTIVLLPVLIGLFAGKGAVPGGLFSFGFRYEFNDIFRSLFFYVDNIWGLPQLYTGTFTLIASICFFVTPKIGKREKIAAAVIFGFMILSTWFAPFDRIWLGLRDGNSFYCRFVFLISALMFFFAARFLSVMDKESYRRIAGVGAVILVITVIIFCDGHYERFRHAAAAAALAVCLPLLLIAVDRFKGRKLGYPVLSALLILVICVEAAFSFSYVIQRRNVEGTTGYYDRYEQYYSEGHAMMDAIEEKEGSDLQAYRMEKTYNFLSPYRRIALNETLAFSYKGLALYDSVYDDRVQNLLVRLGYTPDSYVRTSFNEPMLVADSLLGIKYIVSDTRPPGYVETDIPLEWDGGKVYENPYALPLGYGVSEDIFDEISFSGNPFEFQNDLVNAMVGKDVDCVVDVETRFVGNEGLSWTWEVEIPEGKQLYAYIESPYEVMGGRLFMGDEYVYEYLDEWSSGMFAVSEPEQGETQTITWTGELPEGAEAPVLHAAFIDEDAFVEAIDTLSARPFEATTFDDGHVVGDYFATQEEILLTTIPYDTGWTVTLNGERVEPEIVDDALIAIRVPAGENHVEMNYVSPGFIPGAVVSVVSGIAFIAWSVFIRRRDAKSIDRSKGSR